MTTVSLNGKIINGRLAEIFANRNIGKVVSDSEVLDGENPIKKQRGRKKK